MLTIGVMWLIARQIVHRPMHYPIVQDQPNASLVLPDAIRIVDAFGCRYGLEADSGVVTEEKTWTETTHTTYTTPGSVQTVGDAVYSFPGRQETYSHTVQKDRLWLRDSSGHEAVWVITGGVFSVRVGHVVSRVGTRSGEAVDFIVACNQTTGQCVVFNGPIGRYHGGSSRGALVWPVFVGIAGWVYGGWRLIPLLGIEPFPMALLSFSILGAIGSVIIAFVLNSRIHRKLFLKRNAYFAQKYLPAIRQFLKDQSPAILARFGSAPSRA
jgi:hypothetical protein